MPLCPVLDNYFFSHKSLYLQDASHCYRISTRHVHPSRQSRHHTALKHVMMFPILFPICSAHSQIWPSFLLFTEPYPLIIKLFKLKNTHKIELCTALTCIRLCEYLLGHTHTHMLPGRDRWPGSSLLSLPINSLPQRYPWFWFPSPQTSFAYPVFWNPIVCSTGFFCSTHQSILKIQGSPPPGSLPCCMNLHFRPHPGLINLFPHTPQQSSTTLLVNCKPHEGRHLWGSPHCLQNTVWQVTGTQ